MSMWHCMWHCKQAVVRGRPRSCKVRAHGGRASQGREGHKRGDNGLASWEPCLRSCITSLTSKILLKSPQQYTATYCRMLRGHSLCGAMPEGWKQVTYGPVLHKPFVLPMRYSTTIFLSQKAGSIHVDCALRALLLLN